MLDVVFMCSSFAARRRGYFDDVYHFLPIWSRVEVIICLFFDPTSPGADVAFPSPVLGLCFIEITEEPIPRDVPVPCGVPVLMTCFVVASYAPTKVTLRSHTGIFIKLNCAPIAWYSNDKYC